MAKSLKENKNVRYSIPTDKIFETKKETNRKVVKIKQEIIMGDKIKVGDISNNKGQISVGKKNKAGINEEDEFLKKSFNWQKWGIIIGTIISVIAIIVSMVYSK